MVSEDSGSKKKKSGRLPSPQELVSHCEKQGMETHQASLKVIQNMQTALFMMVTANRTRKSTDSKLDVVRSRLLNLEMKLDFKTQLPSSTGSRRRLRRHLECRCPTLEFRSPAC